ncbi:hypothetical protein [Romboutsia ilealis]|uniref:hypothetical protein n=1 Tax=Romboutsia ilealis TaxID=1115758 RepID=UPI00272B4142|nr:hypothetical protein [Romboutsia ilealis]
MNTVDYIYRDMKELLETIVIKYDRLAKDGETVESRRDSDRYISAKLELDTFNSHVRFSKDAIRNCGVFDEKLVTMYHEDKKLMPDFVKSRVLAEERFLIIENYEEKNNYYREMIGKPNTDDFDYIYLPLDVCKKYGLNSRTPIHEYRDDEIYKIEKTILPDLINKYPNKGYLKFLGSKKVDLVRARRAQNFEIIKGDLIQNTVFLNKFFETYIACREYFTSVIYIKEFSSKYDLYDNFIAMHIMLMTVQRMMVNTFKIGVERDFYDLPSIKALFDSYGLPFFEELPLDYQRSIMKNLNMLLRYKSTDKVLYDISNILFFDRIKIYKYFLIKEREFDKKGNPIFAFKEVVNENGEVEIVEDVEKMYSFYFQSTDILERNTALALENSHNKISYAEVTESDMFWWDDEDVQKVLYEQEFNYVETKYLSVNVMYRLTETMFESIYALNMLADKKYSSTESVYIDIPRVTLDKISVFDAVISLFALTSKKCGMKGNIISTPTQILSVLGFNFKANFDEIINQVYSNKSNLPEEIVNHLINIDISSPDDINEMYSNIRWLADFLTDRINNTTSLKEYRACKDLYETLMIKDYTTDILKKRDGKVASTYLEYLKDQSPRLGEFIDNCPKEKADVYIKHIIGKINELIPELDYMSTLEGSDNVLIKALMKMIEFFKSYTVDLNSLNVLYVMDSKYYNMIRMVHDINFMSKIIQNNERSFREYFDTIATHIKLDGREQLEFLHRCFASKDALFKYLHEILDEEYINKTLGLKSNIPDLTDKDRAEIFKLIESYDETKIYSKEEYYINIDTKYKLTMKDLIREIVTKIFIKESSMINLYNDTVEIICKCGYKFKINLYDFTEYFSKLYIDIYLTLDEKYALSSIVEAKDLMLDEYMDILEADSKIEDNVKLDLKDHGLPIVTISREDKFARLFAKIQDSKVLARIRSMFQYTNIIEIFNQMSTQYNISLDDWVNIHNMFKVIDHEYMGIEFWYNSHIDYSDFVLNNYIDLLKSVKAVSLATRIKPSELCNMYISLSRKDDMKLKDTTRYRLMTFLRDNIKSVNSNNVRKMLDTPFMKPYIQKTLGINLMINTRDLYRVYRSLHRDDKIKIRERNIWDSELEAKVLLLTKFTNFMNKTNTMKFKTLFSDQMKVLLQHNLKSLIELGYKLKSSTDIDISVTLLDIYNGFVCSMQSFINTDNDNIPLIDKNPVTIIRHNFEELQKINMKLMEYEIGSEVMEFIFDSYHNLIDKIEKEISPIKEIPTLIDEASCVKVDVLICNFLDEIESKLHHVNTYVDHIELDLKNIREFVTLFGNIYYKERLKVLSKIQRLHINIDIAYIMLINDPIHSLSDICQYNDVISSLLFNRIGILDIIKQCEKFNLSHMICSSYKDFYSQFNIDLHESNSFTEIIEMNETLATLYSDYMKLNKNVNTIDKTNFEDRIKVFYE